MPLPTHDLILLLLASLAAGALNAVAGGGSFLTFPALVLAGVPPLIANATNTVALLPATFTSAWIYRDDLAAARGQVPLWRFIGVSFIGGALGSLLLLCTPEKLFEAIVPWLLAFATAVFAFGKLLSAWLRSRMHMSLAALIAMQFLIGLYGGYFGGGIGILMLAMLGLYGMTDLHAMNGVKTLLSGCMNLVAAAVFIIAGAVWWREAGLMFCAAMAGGVIGPWLARRVPMAALRAFVIAVGVTMTVYFFLRR
jgi:uncharacterized membrane protein YfcA